MLPLGLCVPIYICMCVCVHIHACVLHQHCLIRCLVSTTNRSAAVIFIPILLMFHYIPHCMQQGIIGLSSCHETNFCFFSTKSRFLCGFLPSAAHLDALAHSGEVRYSLWKYCYMQHTVGALQSTPPGVSFQVCS